MRDSRNCALRIPAAAWCIQAAVFLCLCAATPVRADRLQLRGGAALDVAVLEENDTEIKFATLSEGTHVVLRADVAALDASEFPLDELDRRREEAGNDAAALTALGRWCEDSSLFRQGYEIWNAVVEESPEFEGARTALGYVKEGGEWKRRGLWRERYQRYLDAVARDEAGLIPVGGDWVSPKELDVLLAGGRRMRGHWLTDAQAQVAMRLNGMEVVEGRSLVQNKLDLDLNTVKSELFHVESCLSEAENKNIIRELTACYRLYLDLLGKAPQERLWDGPVSIYIFETKADAFLYYKNWLESDNTPEMSKLMESNPRTYWLGYPGMLMYKFKGSSYNLIAGELTHMFAHQLLYHTGVKAEAPAWLNEGFAAWLEYSRFGASSGFCYVPSENAGIENFQGNRWLEWTAEQVAAKQDRPLGELLKSDLAELSLPDLAKCFCVVDHLVSLSPDCFGRVVRAAKEAADDQGAMFELVFTETPEEFDAAWRPWMRARAASRIARDAMRADALRTLKAEFTETCTREWFQTVVHPILDLSDYAGGPGGEDVSRNLAKALGFDFTDVVAEPVACEVTGPGKGWIRSRVTVSDETQVYQFQCDLEYQINTADEWVPIQAYAHPAK